MITESAADFFTTTLFSVWRVFESAKGRTLAMTDSAYYPRAKHDEQQVDTDHELADEDVLRIITSK